MENKSKKFNLPMIIGAAAIVVVAIVLIFVLGKGKNKELEKIDKTKSVAKAYELISAEYRNIACVDDCEYFYAYKGEEDLKGEIVFFNETGKKIGSFKLEGTAPEVLATLDIEGITNNYFILSYMDTKKLDYKYAVYNMKNKIIVEPDEADVITDKYIEITKDDKNYIFDNTGKTVYENVDDVRVYNDEYITFEINEVGKIINKDGKELLSGYTIAKVVLDEEENVDYLIVKNTEESVYNYYDVKENTKKGDSFTSYTTIDNQVIITKKVESKSEKFVLSSNGEQTKYEDKKVTTNENYYDEVKEKVDTEKYPIFSSTVKEKNQNYILVNSLEDNKFGILDVSKKEFTELGTYKENSSRRLTLKQINGNDDIEGNNDIIFSIECSRYYCDNGQQFIYNFSKNKLLMKRDSTKESLIYSFKLYDNGYYVIKNTSSEFDDSSKYILYDSKGKELAKSSSDIKVLGSEVSYHSASINNTGRINLYSLDDKKIINVNSDDEIASVSSKEYGEQKLYQFTMDEKIYLITEEGKITELKGTLKQTDDVGIYYMAEDEIKYYNIFTKENSSYKLGENESMNGSTGSELVPYRNAIFVNNSYDYIIKVIGKDGKVLLEKKGLQIYKTEEKEDGSILMIVTDKNDNKGVYIVR